MTELNYTRNHYRFNSVGKNGVIKVISIYGLLISAITLLFNINILMGYSTVLSEVFQPVINSIVNYCPIEVNMPTVPLGPSWNGSGDSGSHFIETSELLYKINQ